MNYSRTVSSIIQNIDRQIAKNENQNKKLIAKKEAFQKVAASLPDLIIGRNDILCSKSVASDISCMKIYKGSSYRYSYNFTFVLHTNNKKYGKPIYLSDNYFVAATFSGWGKDRTIEIKDFASLIPDEVKKKDKFVKRIKRTIVQLISKDKLKVSPKSHDFESYRKLLALV